MTILKKYRLIEHNGIINRYTEDTNTLNIRTFMYSNPYKSDIIKIHKYIFYTNFNKELLLIAAFF